MTLQLEKIEAGEDSLFAYGKPAPGKLAEDGSRKHKRYKVIADTGGVAKVYYKWNGQVYI